MGSMVQWGLTLLVHRYQSSSVNPGMVQLPSHSTPSGQTSMTMMVGDLYTGCVIITKKHGKLATIWGFSNYRECGKFYNVFCGGSAREWATSRFLALHQGILGQNG